MSALLEQLNEGMGDVVDRVGQSLVRVSAGGKGFGSGAVWHSGGSQALIITNAHMVSGASGVRNVDNGLTLTLADGSTHSARLLAQNTGQDLAALSIDLEGGTPGDAGVLTPVVLGDSRSLEPGHWVIALGHPWGVAGAAVGGAVIGWGADLPEFGSEDGAREWIAAGLSLRPGHSGGPLVDAQGRLVGICTMMAGPQVGMAVPVHTAKDFLKRELGTKV